MRVALEIKAGPHAGQHVEVRPGQVSQVGRSGWADVSLPDDPALADLHFVLECGESACRVRDLHTASGIYLNGSRVVVATLRDGDRIVAGQTAFAVHLGAAPPSVPGWPGRSPGDGAHAESDRPRRLLGVLRGSARPLYAVLDAARDDRILPLLRESGEEFRSLYEGLQGEVLAEYAPYLVRLPAGSTLLEALAAEGWGQSWGIYLRSDAPLADVRKHFRRFLIVKLEGGQAVYFRFYDPRVLREFLPTCTRDEAGALFGPIDAYLVESKDPEHLLTFSLREQGAGREVVPLSRST